MSASLVGSEMCIRDRLLQQRPRLRGCRAAVAPAAAPAAASASPQHSAPVSYTHLTLPTICSV
eukprot:12589248-Alexandrium_andersonii.AAC.1